MLTVKECAARATVCESVVRAWVASGLLSHYRVGASGKGGKILVEEADLAALLASLKVAAAPPPVAKPPEAAAARAAPLRHLKL